MDAHAPASGGDCPAGKHMWESVNATREGAPVKLRRCMRPACTRWDELRGAWVVRVAHGQEVAA